MLAGYGRYLNDNVRTAHLKCVCCRTQVHLVKVENNQEGWEIRSFACRHCDGISLLLLRIGKPVAEAGELRDLDAC